MASKEPIRGRGTAWNPANRFDGGRSYETDDCYEVDPVELDTGRPPTQFMDDSSKSILSHNTSPDVPLETGINPYRGCEHGCVYCFARPTHEYMGYSAGLDFETKVFVKRDAAALLRKELGSRSWKPQVIALSGNTDPYQPVERELGITRQCLEVLREHRNPVSIITKNRLVTRDRDILADMARDRCAAVYLSVTTLDLGLNRILEPRSSAPQQRLEAIRALREAGVPVGVLVAPVIPGLTDHEVPRILEACQEAGAQYASYILLRLPHAVAPLFEDWLGQHFPERKEKVLNRLRSLRGGALYRHEFGERMRGTGEFAEQLRSLFAVSVRKFGLDKGHATLSAEHFRRPGQDQMMLL